MRADCSTERWIIFRILIFYPPVWHIRFVFFFFLRTKYREYFRIVETFPSRNRWFGSVASPEFTRECRGTIGRRNETGTKERGPRGEKSTANRKADHNERLHHAGDRSHFGTRRTSFFFARSFWPTCDDGSEPADTPPLKDNNRGSRYLEESTEKLERSTPFRPLPIRRLVTRELHRFHHEFPLRFKKFLPSLSFF